MAMDSRIWPTTVITLALCAAMLACQGPPHAEAAVSPFEQLAADSAAGDSAAFAALPEPLRAYLDVREAIATLPELASGCVILPPRTTQELRRRLRFRSAERDTAVLYVVSDAQTGSIGRVEFIRRMPGRGRRGLIWDAQTDRTSSTWWNEMSWGLSRRVERGEIPRGGPVPRALRGLGRQLLLLPCESAPDSTVVTLP